MPLNQDIGSLILLLTLSDRFNITELTSLCVQAIAGRSFSTMEAIQLLCLPDSLLNLPGMRLISVAARTRLSSICMPGIKAVHAKQQQPPGGSSFEHKAVKDFLQIPEAALRILIEPDNIVGVSEGQILAAGCVWACANSRTPEENLALLARVVLPGIQGLFLSPQDVQELSQEINLLTNVEMDAYIEDGHTEDAHSTAAVAGARVRAVFKQSDASVSQKRTRGGSAPEAVVNAYVVASQLSRCLEKLRAAGLDVPAGILGWHRPKVFRPVATLHSGPLLMAYARIGWCSWSTPLLFKRLVCVLRPRRIHECSDVPSLSLLPVQRYCSYHALVASIEKRSSCRELKSVQAMSVFHAQNQS